MASGLDYSGAAEKDLLRSAQFYEKQKFDPQSTPEQRSFAESEYEAIGNELQRRSPIEVTYETPTAFNTDMRGTRQLEPGDPGPPLTPPQGLIAGERFSPENKYNKEDFKADVGRVVDVVTPGLGMINRKLRSDEEQARAEAQQVKTTEQVPQGVDIGALREAEAALTGGSGPSMGVSATQGNVSQVERKVLPPEWYKSLDRYTEEARSAAVGEASSAAAMNEIQRQAAGRRRDINADFRQSVEESAVREATALGNARRRIGSAIERYRQSGPRFESVGTVLREARGGAGVAGGIGLVLGIIGGAATGQANGFTEAVTQNIERRARIAELESEKQARAISMDGDNYRRLQGEIGDARATRSLVRALYLEDLKDQIIEKGAAVGIMASDARLSGLLAQIEQQRLGYLEKAASVVMNQARSEQTVAPMKGEGGSSAEAMMPDYVRARKERGMDVMEGGIRLMQNGVQQIGGEKPNAAQSLLFRQVLANPLRWASLSSLAGQLSKGQQAFINGFLQFLTSDAGKALTESERQGIASALGKGDVEGLQEAVRNFQTRLDTLDRGLVPQFGKTIDLYRLRQQIHDAENPRKLYDVRGVETQPPVTERPPVVSGGS